MATPSVDLLPISETAEPASTGEVASLVAQCHHDGTAVYPIGGGTSLDFGLPARRSGIGVSLSKVNAVVDYPARDMTITVGAGITMAALSELLAAQGQRFPVDVPAADRATLGGVVATNFNGPRRFGQGTVRDYVIGVTAVDGRGMSFKGGGRVVKNVAGYDFCKLLTGSLGTLGVITQLTLKLKPIPQQLAFMVCSLENADVVEQVLSQLVTSRTTPVAVELMRGKSWPADLGLQGHGKPSLEAKWHLAVALEGYESEVRWMCDQLGREWWDQGVTERETLLGTDAVVLMQRMTEFPATGGSPLVLKANVVPSGVTGFIVAAMKLDPDCSVLSHAGDGIVVLRLSQAPHGGVTRGLIGTLQSAAVAAQGSVIVLSGAGTDATHPSVWGTNVSGLPLMNAVKREFDPKNILNPDRFVYYA